MSLVFTMLLAAFLSDIGEVKSGALLQTLPDDGAWTTFQIHVTGDNRDLSFTWTVRSVGTVVHDGKLCRYLELEQKIDAGPKEIFTYQLVNTTCRAVIPEAEFGEGKNPLAHAVYIWVQKNQDSPISVSSIDLYDPILAAIIRGPVSDLKAEDGSDRIQWQRDNIDCRVIAGKREMDFFGAKVVLSARVLRNHEIPFSIGGIRQELKATLGNADYQVTVRADLLDLGTDAKPTLGQLTP